MTIPKIASYPMPTQAPENRVQWTLEAQRAVVLVHDMQDYFLDFYDRLAAPIPTLLANTSELLARARAQQVPVVYTAQLPEQSQADRALLNDMWGPGLTAHPQRKDIAALLQPQPGDVVLDKWRYSAFQRSDLRETMRQWGRDQLVICGVYAHIGCMLTAAEAFMADVQPFFVVDALADFSEQEHAMAARYVSQRCGVSLLTQDALKALRTALPQSVEDLRRTIAQQLQIPAQEISLQDSLLDWGLDSIRIMALLETWRAAGCELSFMQLAQDPTLQAWWALLQGHATVQKQAEEVV
ncbi:isochorismatase family protein [Curvibacter sp. CHRR-16]|uniref:isochorismatase family protein n=1 Tax=Curvibacter sp. CHRR-16 TaxID=2835872 RepID=UPI001BDB55EE|nr:isochorismatase family protein [Curvibacter sp. CHRR-16]MBT0570236.1 isochorismatase family protein [Curvibacter sp. CHRR-16]